MADASVVAKIAELGIDMAEDGAVFISRSLNTKGKSTCRINGKSMPITILREISPLLIDIHGQHEHQSLLDSTKHIQLLDRFCIDELSPKRTELSKLIADYRGLLKKIAELSEDKDEQSVEMYSFQKAEIEQAEVLDLDEEALLSLRKTLSNAQKLAESAADISSHFGGDSGILEKLSLSAALAANIAALDPSVGDIAAEIDSAAAHLTEVWRDFCAYTENLENSPQHLNEVEEQLDKIYKFKQKYRRSLLELNQYYADICQKLLDIENSRDILDELSAEKKSMDKDIGRICIEMNKIRKEAALSLGLQIEGILHSLGMENARFLIEIGRQNTFSANGFDRVEFMISANKGADPAPLSKIASGGEMSRVMLAVKTVLADFDTIDTFIFDEIDTGISGRTAQQVAQKLAVLSKNHQIICITHLPQIAAMGNTNFLIKKETVGERTFTHIFKLDAESIFLELARLIGGAEITNTTLTAAKEMRELAIATMPKG